MLGLLADLLAEGRLGKTNARAASRSSTRPETSSEVLPETTFLEVPAGPREAI